MRGESPPIRKERQNINKRLRPSCSASPGVLTTLTFGIGTSTVSTLKIQGACNACHRKEMGRRRVRQSAAAIMAAASLRLDEAVDVREEDGRIVIEPIQPREDELDQLLAAITPENRHAEADFGDPVGKESL